MARKGATSWHVFKRTEAAQMTPEQRGAGVIDILARERHYALRSDGVLVSKVVSEWPDQWAPTRVTRHDGGWKIYTRRPRSDALEYLIARGYQHA